MANHKPIKYTAIPRNNTDKAVSALSTIAETLIGAKGNGLEKAVTFRDLQDLDLVTIRRTLDGRNFIFDPINPGDNDGPSVETPTAPTNFTATGGFTSILLRWDFPTYGGHSYTEIWRAETNVLGNASLLVNTNSLNYSDIPGNNFTGYYWARHVNQNGVEGPFHNTSGELGQTAEDVEFNISVLNGKISDIHLNSYLGGQVDLIASTNDTLTEQQGIISRLEGDVNTNHLSLVSLDSAFNDPATGLPATRATIANDYYTIALADEAIAASRLLLRSEFFDPDTSNLTSALVDKIDTTISNANGAIATALTNLVATVDDPNTGVVASQAAITDNFQAIVDDTGGIISSHITAYTVTKDGVTGTLAEWAEVAADADANFKAQWGFKATVGELTGGVGFVNDGTVVQFVVQADRFAIIDPRNDEVKSIFATVVNDPVLPDGVYIDTAFIKAATIAELVAGEINADTVTAGISIDTPLITSGTIVGGVIKSPTFEMIGTNFMEVKKVEGFGNENLYYWFGPRLLTVDGEPNYAALTKANALEWKDTAGNAYFGGSLSAGVLKNAARSTTLALFPSVSIGPFTTNGNLKQVVVAISWSGSFSGTGATPTNPTQPSAVLTLERSSNGSDWSFLTDFTASGTTIINEFYESGAPDYISFENLSETGFTYTDNTPGVANVYYRVTASSQVRYHLTQNINNQVLSLISTEA